MSITEERLREFTTEALAAHRSQVPTTPPPQHLSHPIDAAAVLDRIRAINPKPREAQLVEKLTVFEKHPRYQDFPLAQQRLARAKGLCRYPFPDPVMLEAGLQAAIDAGCTVRYDRDGYIVIRGKATPRIVFEEDDVEVDLGPFEPGIVLKRTHWVAFAVALDPVPDHTEYHVHPHVSSDRGRYKEVCLGDAARPVAALVLGGAFDAAINLISDGLQQYNPDSPYHAIKDWERPRTCCEGCGEFVDREDGEGGVTEGGDILCNECGTWCDDRFFYADDVSWCETCENDRLCDDMRSCPCCGESVCRNCLEGAL